MKKTTLHVLIALTSFVLYPPCSGQTVADVNNLKTFLFTTGTYDKFIRPVANKTMATTVYIDYFLAGKFLIKNTVDLRGSLHMKNVLS